MVARKKQTTGDPEMTPAEHKAEVAFVSPTEAGAPKEREPRQVGPATQKVIDRILDMRRQGMGFPSIAKTLNDEKVNTFGSGKTWHPPVVRGICLRHGVEKGEQAAK